MTAPTTYPITKSDEKSLKKRGLDPDRAAWGMSRDPEEELAPVFVPDEPRPGETVRAYLEGLWYGLLLGVPMLGLIIWIGECMAR